MATKTLFKIGGIGGAGTFAVVDVNGTPFVQINGTIQASIASLTDNTGGVASDTLAGAAGANPTAAEFENAVASLAAKVNAILAALDGAGITS